MDKTALAEIVDELAGHPQFGDWQVILARLATYYDAALELLASQANLEPAGRLRTALQTMRPSSRLLIFTDTVFRVVVNRAVQVCYGYQTEPSGEAYREAQDLCGALEQLVRIEPDLQVTPLQALGAGRAAEYRAGRPPFHLTGWQPQQVVAGFGVAERFRQIVEQEIEPDFALVPCRLRGLTRPERDRLEQGLELLSRVSPALALQPLVHIRAVGIVDLAGGPAAPDYAGSGILRQRSNNNVPAAVFFSPPALGHPLEAAEALLHEGLHQKMTDLVTVYDIFISGFDRDRYPAALAHWNADRANNSNRWQVDRALYAFHFYVHICSYYALLAARWEQLTAGYGAPAGFDPAAACSRAVKRANYLYTELVKLAQGPDSFLGGEGQQLLHWLGRMAQRFNSLELPGADLRIQV